MKDHGIPQRHRTGVFFRGITDAGLYVLAMNLASLVRLGWSDTFGKFRTYLPAEIIGGLVLACGLYVVNNYNLNRPRSFRWALLLQGSALAIATIALSALFYVGAVEAVGRGVVILGAVIALVSVSAHYYMVRWGHQFERERAGLLVCSQTDELELRELEKLCSQHFNFVGVIFCGTPPPRCPDALGTIDQLSALVARHKINRLICSSENLHREMLRKPLTEALFSGVTLNSTIAVCEEVLQYAPINLITPEWLLQASAYPSRNYIQKIKRAFDVIVSLSVLLIALPLLATGILLVWLTSPGPAFYRQVRSGIFGRQITLLKLRTMYIDAERDGPKWSVKGDSRITPVGNFLRKYRIDELPQLFSILKGEMSFVGPRPERPNFYADLEQRVPYFSERLMVQPGLTGWAQVNYPYGATSEDAWRKLEYDFYYMKHMSLFFDLLILLDTARIIIGGGVRSVQPAVFKTPPVATATQSGGDSTVAHA